MCFKYVDIFDISKNGCKLYAFDIIIHDTWHKVRFINCSMYTCNMSEHAMAFYIAYAQETSHFIGVSAWLVNRHYVWCLIGWARSMG